MCQSFFSFKEPPRAANDNQRPKEIISLLDKAKFYIRYRKHPRFKMYDTGYSARGFEQAEVYYLFKENTGRKYDEIQILHEGRLFSIYKGEILSLKLNSNTGNLPDRVRSYKINKPVPLTESQPLQSNTLVVGIKEGALFLKPDFFSPHWKTTAKSNFQTFYIKGISGDKIFFESVKDFELGGHKGSVVLIPKNNLSEGVDSRKMGELFLKIEEEGKSYLSTELIKDYDIYAVIYNQVKTGVSSSGQNYSFFLSSIPARKISEERMAGPWDVLTTENRLIVTSWETSYFLQGRYGPRKHEETIDSLVDKMNENGAIGFDQIY